MALTAMRWKKKGLKSNHIGDEIKNKWLHFSKVSLQNAVNVCVEYNFKVEYSSNKDLVKSENIWK